MSVPTDGDGVFVAKMFVQTLDCKCVGMLSVKLRTNLELLTKTEMENG